MAEYIRIPAPFDPHVHLREPGSIQKEDFTTGTRAAISGGYPIIADMPNNTEPTISPEALQRKIDLATDRIYCDLRFNYGATRESSKTFGQVYDMVNALKVYMNPTTGNLLVEKQEDLEEIFSKWPRGQKPIMVHSEGETFERAINLARKTGQRLHLCHMSLESEVNLVRQAKNEGLPITCEVSAHHLFLNDSDLPDLGSHGIMKPPLATEKDRVALWNNLDVIDIVASDHAPHTEEEKAQNPAPFGVPGLETTIPLLLNAVNVGRLQMEKLVDMVSTKPRKIFGLPDDPTTYTEVDMNYANTLDSKYLETKAGWTPFDGWIIYGRVARVVLRGVEVFDGDIIIGKPQGRVI